MKSTLPSQASQHLRNSAARLENSKALVGFDGFVDTIIHIVQQRESATRYQRMAKMGEFACRIQDAAGLSANFEFVTQMVKLGGNGPIMANALVSAGLPVTYIGNLGKPNLHPVFEDFSKRATVISIAEPGYTDALEFEDGKLMCGKHESLKEVNWANLTKALPEAKLVKMFQESSLISLVNWTMLQFMGTIFQKIQTQIGPKLKGEKRWVFFDLADPAKRTTKDIAAVLRQISKFEKHFRVILGLNLNESRQIGQVLGIASPAEEGEAVAAHAKAIREKLKISTVVIHPTSFAAAADAKGATFVKGPYVEKPKITTGAGDHFNAGFCLGMLSGGDIATSLQIGVATSGFYVRRAKSPSLEELRKFLKTL